MMQRGDREADPQTRKTKFGPTFYVFYLKRVYLTKIMTTMITIMTKSWLSNQLYDAAF